MLRSAFTRTNHTIRTNHAEQRLSQQCAEGLPAFDCAEIRQQTGAALERGRIHVRRLPEFHHPSAQSATCCTNDLLLEECVDGGIAAGGLRIRGYGDDRLHTIAFMLDGLQDDRCAQGNAEHQDALLRLCRATTAGRRADHRPAAAERRFAHPAVDAVPHPRCSQYATRKSLLQIQVSLKLRDFVQHAAGPGPAWTIKKWREPSAFGAHADTLRRTVDFQRDGLVDGQRCSDRHGPYNSCMRVPGTSRAKSAPNACTGVSAPTRGSCSCNSNARTAATAAAR